MTLSISDQPSQWDRPSHYPKRLSLLTDATIDPFPSKCSRSASLLEHHIFQAPDLNQHGLVPKNGHESSVPFGPVRALAVHDATLPSDRSYDFRGRKRSAAMTNGLETADSSSPTSQSHGDGTNQFCLCQPEPKIPRPRNAFILYRQHQQAAVARKHPGLPNPAISKIIGEQWSQLPEESKNEWKALAEEEKARHAQQYPDYRYQPRRNGRYSSQSSASAQLAGKVDQQGNCLKCGGKTMNPPTLPYSSQQPMASSPQAPTRTYVERGWTMPPHDSAPRYVVSPEATRDGPDLKRRRFDGSGIYIPTREGHFDARFQYSPRAGAYTRTYLPHEIHPPRSATLLPSQAHAMYAPASHPRIQLARPPHRAQTQRDPSLTLPPIAVSDSQQGNQLVTQQVHNTGVEAMIMSIPVLNKVKILSQISPSLPTPGPASPPFPVRGAVVAVEGLDSTSVYGMTNSIAEQLEKDGKFAVRIFGGPDPYNSVKGSENGKLTFQDCFDVCTEWHKINEEIKQYITTKPGGSLEDDGPTPSQTSRSTAGDPEKVTRTQATAASPTKVNKEDTAVNDNSEPSSGVSPKTMSKAAELSIATPPSNRTDFATDSTTNPDPVFTRIPFGALPPSTPTSARKLDTLPPASPSPTTTSSLPAPPLNPNINTSAVLTQFTNPFPSTSTSSPIPIALIPHYQLTTVDASSLSLPILDSYSPLAHWQWLATLWRGCIGPDVTVVIKNGAVEVGGGAGTGSGSVGGGEDPSSPAKPAATVQNATNGDATTGAASAGAHGDTAGQTAHERTRKQSTFNSTAANTSTSNNRISNHIGPTGTSISASQARPSMSGSGSISAARLSDCSIGQGIDVRLQDCRAVVVRMNLSRTGQSHSEGGGGGAQQEKEKKDIEFWEKAKRRVGFEVCEFLRR